MGKGVGANTVGEGVGMVVGNGVGTAVGSGVLCAASEDWILVGALVG